MSSRASRGVVAGAAFAMALALWGCPSFERIDCRVDADCAGGLVCEPGSGSCVAAGGGSGGEGGEGGGSGGTGGPGGGGSGGSGGLGGGGTGGSAGDGGSGGAGPCVPTPELCDNGLDEDCDHKIDCGDPDCRSAIACCVLPRILCGGTCVDTDSDRLNCGGCGTPCGQGESCRTGSCELCVSAVPAAEHCSNRLDDDCNGLADCADPACASDDFCCGDRDGSCGDGCRDAGEECDDGNRIPTDRCTDGCTIGRCGDGLIRPGERCDDGNAIEDDACNGFCEPCQGGVTYQGHCYRREVEPHPWAEAAARCTNQGAYLAVLDSQVENDWIRSYLIDPGLVGGPASYWLGLSELETDGSWRWITGQPLIEESWGTPPASGNQERCARIENGAGSWLEASCTQTEGYLCEAEAARFNFENAHLYAVSYAPTTWHVARERCESVPGGHLATISTAEEARFLAEWLPTLRLWLGVTDGPDPGGHGFITGEPMVLNFWAEGEPVAGALPQCASWGQGSPDGVWYASSCDDLRPSLCEYE